MYFSPCFFKHWGIYCLLILIWLCKSWIIVLRICISILLANCIVHIKKIINSNYPWFSSDVQNHAIYWSIIFCWGKKIVFYQSRKLSYCWDRCDVVAISQLSLSALIKTNLSIGRKELYTGVCIWPSLPKVIWTWPLVNRWGSSESVPVNCHCCVEWRVSPLLLLANNIWDIWRTSFKSLNSCSAKWRNLFYQRSHFQS